MTADIAIALSQIGKRYRIYNRPEDRLKQMLLGRWRCYFHEFEALKNLSLTIRRGETVGLIGRNGSGKSTLLQIICGTLAATSGECHVNGRISALLELGAGFNPEFSGHENIALNAAILGLSPAEIAEKYDAIVAFSGLSDQHLRQAVKTYSSGMVVRLAFAVAVAVEPDILIVDEALAVGDEAFQRKCYARIREMQEKGTTILFVSHAAQTVIELCDRAVLIDAGEMLADGAAKDMISAYHRLIFAPADARDAIRDQIVRGVLSAAPTGAAVADVSDPSLTTESRIEYERLGGEILHPAITTLEGEPVNVLQTGQRYQFRYHVRYTQAAHKAKFGMLIKTKRGINLGGAVATALADAASDVAAGDELAVCFSFDCPFAPGHYFINCGATKREGDDDVFIHRIIDALQFKVIDSRPRGGIEPAGHIDLEVQADISTAHTGSSAVAKRGNVC